MLVLSRRQGEEICINDRIRISVLSVRGGRVRIGIAAPAEIRVVRKELLDMTSPSQEADRATTVSPVRGQSVNRTDAVLSKSSRKPR
jgi:carbon storage regulator